MLNPRQRWVERSIGDGRVAARHDSGDDRLRAPTREFWRGCGNLYLSAVSLWEVAWLVDTGRIGLDLPGEAWVTRFLERLGIEPVPLGHHAASSSYQLHHLEHRDPADRLLIATAIELACPLVTYDKRILRFGENQGPQHRFAATA
jgi:PIN domain nuclease of toxin-antitoxin system